MMAAESYIGRPTRIYTNESLSKEPAFRYQWRPADEGSVELFRKVLGNDYHNHGGVLRVTTIKGVEELHAGDELVILTGPACRRVSRPKEVTLKLWNEQWLALETEMRRVVTEQTEIVARGEVETIHGHSMLARYAQLWADRIAELREGSSHDALRTEPPA